MSPIERKAAFKAAVTLHETTMAFAAQSLGVSYNHLMLVLRGDRIGSQRLERAIAEFIKQPVERVFVHSRDTKTVKRE
jgi:hypothetical protein